MTVGSSTATVSNEFEVVPVITTANANIAYTDEDGKTYVSVSNGDGSYTTYEASTEADLAVAVTLKAKITYSGDLTDKDSVKALWESLVNTVTLSVSCTETGGSALSGSPATTDVRFVADDDADSSGDNAKTKNATEFTWSNANTTAELSFGIVYAALTGSDSLVVDATHIPTYKLTVTPTHALKS